MSDPRKYRNFRQRLSNPMCAEFGIKTEDELVYFIEKQLPDFRVVSSMGLLVV